MGTGNTGNVPQIDFGHWALRLVAIIIDGIIIGIISWIIWSFLFVAIVFVGSFAYLALGFFYWLFYLFGTGIIWVIYAVVLESMWSATVGKRILGLQVQTVNGGKPDMGKLFLRNISKIIPPLVILDWLIGILTPGDKRQKYTDRMAGTTVVQIGKSFINMPPPASSEPPK
jgi:uncharacterized RDD family membrane protein YckC